MKSRKDQIPYERLIFQRKVSYILITIITSLNFIIMAQNFKSKNKIIKKGFQLGSGIIIKNDTIRLKPHIRGFGSVAWIFEISDNQLAIVDFYWNVRPGALLFLHTRIKRTFTKTEKLTANLKCIFHKTDVDVSPLNSQIHLIGTVEQSIQIDILHTYPFWTNVENEDLSEVLDKYGLKIIKD